MSFLGRNFYHRTLSYMVPYNIGGSVHGAVSVVLYSIL